MHVGVSYRIPQPGAINWSYVQTRSLVNRAEILLTGCLGGRQGLAGSIPTLDKLLIIFSLCYTHAGLD